MAKYTVKAGDTKTKLKNELGLDLNFSGYKFKDINKLNVGEVLTIPDKVTTKTQTQTLVPSVFDISSRNSPLVGKSLAGTSLSDRVAGARQSSFDKITEETFGTDFVKAKTPVVNNEVDISKVVEGKKPIQENRVEAPVVEKQQFVDSTTVPEAKTEAVAVDDFGQAEAEGKITTLKDDITSLEKTISEKQARRNEGLEELGVIDDLTTLNQLKSNLQQAEDRALEIPIEARQKLRGSQATKTEFSQETSPQLENQVLQELSASRSVSRLTDIINTNISVVDSRIEADNAQVEFRYNQKMKELEEIEKQHADILSGNQESALEAQKFRQELLLESAKTENDLKSDLLKEIIPTGNFSATELDNLSNMTSNQLLAYQGKNNPESALNYFDLTEEEAFDKWGGTGKFDQWKTVVENNDLAGAKVIDATTSAIDIVSTINKMLTDEEGLENSVGVGFLGNRDFNILGLGSESTAFRANAKKLISAQTLETLKNLKETGATMGALNEAELNILINARQSLGTIMEGQNVTGRFELDQDVFKKELETMRMASMKTYLASRIGKKAFAETGLSEISYDSDMGKREDGSTITGADYISEMYEVKRKNPTATQTTQTQQEYPTQLANAVNSIGIIESAGSGGYQAVGEVIPSGLYEGERALGKYQVMPSNLSQWSIEAGLNFVPTNEQFLSSPDIQDLIVSTQFDKNYKKYGNWNDVASVWFSGKPLENNTAQDVTGTTVPEYVRRFNQNLT